MNNKIWGEEYRTTIVCVDSFGSSEMSGRFYNPYMDGGDSFANLMEFLKKMERMMDEMELPQAVTQRRSFKPAAKPQQQCPGIELSRKGDVATFALNIRYRQNASWQGTVNWLEQHKEQHFRSALELLMLMDSAVNG